jgi:hypothetical protein
VILVASVSSAIALVSKQNERGLMARQREKGLPVRSVRYAVRWVKNANQ